MTTMSIQSSIRAITISSKTFNFKPPSHHHVSLKPFLPPHFPHSFTPFKPITFQKLPTTKPLQSSNSNSSPSLQPIEELPPKLQEIIKLFQNTKDPRAKYQQLLFYGNNLPPLDDKYKTGDNKVEGCVSQVWVRAYFEEDNKDRVCYEADSDAIMTKGLAALLVQGLSGQTVADILKVSPDFATLLGLQQTLTPSRNNGFLNMLRLMQKKAVLLALQAEKGLDGEFGAGDSLSNVEFDGVNGVEMLNREVGRSQIVENGSGSVMGSDDSSRKSNAGEESSSPDSGVVDSGVVENERSGMSLGRRGERIREVLMRELKPVEIEVEDVSYQHAGHAGVRGSDGETHFNLKVVSSDFEGKSMVKRHRIIHGLLQDELQSGLHALSITAKTPSEV